MLKVCLECVDYWVQCLVCVLAVFNSFPNYGVSSQLSLRVSVWRGRLCVLAR